MVHKKSKNLKNGHFLQSRTKIVLTELKFAKFWHIGEWRAPVCLIDTLKNLVFYSKVTIKRGVKFVKQVSKKLNLCRFSSSMTVDEDLFSHHKACFGAKTQSSCLAFLYTHVSVCSAFLILCNRVFTRYFQDEILHNSINSKMRKKI